MNKINRKVEYALIALKHMRGKAPGELTSAKEISSIYGSPFDVTARVMQVLTQKNILRSEHGAHGGYQITKDLNRVSVYDLMELILGPVALAKCLHENESESPCELRGSCNIVSPVLALNRKLIDFYRGLSIAELLDPRGSAMARTSQSAASVAPQLSEAP